jgi:hypothetical protein
MSMCHTAPKEAFRPAADSPRVALKGSSEQVVLGVGATHKFAVQP